MVPVPQGTTISQQLMFIHINEINDQMITSVSSSL